MKTDSQQQEYLAFLVAVKSLSTRRRAAVFRFALSLLEVGPDRGQKSNPLEDFRKLIPAALDALEGEAPRAKLFLAVDNDAVQIP